MHRLLYFLALIPLFLLTSCSEILGTDDDDTGASDTLSLATGGTVDAGNWYLNTTTATGNIQINSGATITFLGTLTMNGANITIDSGVTLRFEESKYLEIGQGAKLTVNGTATAPVTFTNATVGKSWGYGTSENYSGGIWIEDDAATGNSINYAVIENATCGIYSECVNGLTIANTTLKGSTYYGLWLDIATLDTLYNITAMNNGISDVLVKGDVLGQFDSASSFEKGVVLASNATEYSGTIPAYVYKAVGTFYIKNKTTAADSVTIAAGAQFSFSEDAYLEIVDNGKLIVAGTATEPVHMKSADAGKFWGYGTSENYSGGIWIEDDAATGNRFDYLIVDSATCGIYNERENGLQITNSTLKNSQFYGAYLLSGTLDTMSMVTTSGNSLNAVHAANGVATKIGADCTFEKAIQFAANATETMGTLQAYEYYAPKTIYIKGVGSTVSPVTIAPGASFSFKEDAYIEIAQGGQLKAEGTASEGITFTVASIDVGKFWGYGTSPDYSGAIWIEDDAATGNSFDYVTIHNATTGIRCEVVDGVSVSNSTISEYQFHGIHAVGSQTTLFTNNTISSTVVGAGSTVVTE